MRDGLKIIQLPGRYGYSVTKIGYVRRVNGDEYEICAGARTVLRRCGSRGLDQIASDGPGEDHALKGPSKAVEEIHRLLIRRSIPANEGAWQQHIKPPTDWRAEEA